MGGKPELLDIFCGVDGDLTLTPLLADDAEALFDFYFSGLSLQERNIFNPYPLFSPPVNSTAELRDRIITWQKEDDWIVWVLKKELVIIGVGILKRYKANRPVEGVAVRKGFRRMGFATLLMNKINTQARLLGLKRVYASTSQDNIGSLQLHKKCGYKQTGRLIPHFGYKSGMKVVDRQDIEMVYRISSVRGREE